MVLFILRGAFLLLVASVIVLYVNSEFQQKIGYSFSGIAAIMIGAIAVAAAVVALDVSTRHKRLSAVSGIFLGLVAGMVAAFALSFVVQLIGIYFEPTQPTRAEAFNNLLQGIQVIIGLITCYISISLVLQTKDDFRFVIPYVEFAKEIRGNRPTLLDTSIIIDGRILDLVETRVLQGVLSVPKFVLNELQTVADSADKLKRARGRRGLEVLQKLQDSHICEVVIEDRDAEGGNVDQKLISLANDTQARVMTNDYNLNKIAQLRGVDVINLNDVAKAMKPVVLPGEHMTVKLVKPGESPTQAVGYLEDGTMVVVEGGRDQMDREVDITVTSTLQTSAGRMIFGKVGQGLDDSGKHEVPAHPEPAPPPARSSSSGAPPRESRPSRRNPRRS